MITPEISQKMDEILHRMSHTQDHSQQFFIDFRNELKGTFFKEELVELYKRAMSLPYNPQVPAIMHGIAVTYNQGVPLDQKEDLFKKVEELIKTNKEMDMPQNSQMVASIYLNATHPMVSKWMPSFMRAHIVSQNGNFLNEAIHSADPTIKESMVGSLVKARMTTEPSLGKEADANFKQREFALFDSFVNFAKEIRKEYLSKITNESKIENIHTETPTTIEPVSVEIKSKSTIIDKAKDLVTNIPGIKEIHSKIQNMQSNEIKPEELKNKSPKL